MKRICAVLAVLAVGAVGGFLGQAALAQAGAAHHRTVTSDKTIYATWDGSIDSTDPGGDYYATTVLRIHVSAPSAGTVALEMDTAAYSDFSDTNGEPETASNDAYYDRCTSVATHASPGAHCQGLNYFWFSQPGNSYFYTNQPYTQSMLVQFAARGHRTIYINVTSDGVPAGFKGHLHLQAAFTPAHPIETSSHASVSATT